MDWTRCSSSTWAGGVAKMTKLAQGMLDLHSKRGAADLDALASVAAAAGASADIVGSIRGANTVAEAFSKAAEAGVPLGEAIAEGAWRTAAAVLKGGETSLEILIFDRQGTLMGRAPFRPVHLARPR
jgi:cobalt-precorrin-5B (C1)-methyltransferase